MRLGRHNKVTATTAIAILALSLGLTVMRSPAWAQVVNSTLVGTVTDQSGASVPKASVRVTALSTGTIQTTATTEAGTYNVTYLSPQTYSVRIEAPGFKVFTAGSVTFGVSTSVRLDAVLRPGDGTETVTVSGEETQLQTERAEVGRNLTSKTITELPNLNRDVHMLASTVAGVGPPWGGDPGLNNPDGTTNFSANGMTGAAINTIMDGTENREIILGSKIFSPAPELVEEVRVTTSNYAAEFCRVGGATVNVVTKGGTNAFRGAPWDSTAWQH